MDSGQSKRQRLLTGEGGAKEELVAGDEDGKKMQKMVAGEGGAKEELVAGDEDGKKMQQMIEVKVSHLSDSHTFKMAEGSTIEDVGEKLLKETGTFDDTYRMLDRNGILLSRKLSLSSDIDVVSNVLVNDHSYTTLKWVLDSKHITGVDSNPFLLNGDLADVEKGSIADNAVRDVAEEDAGDKVEDSIASDADEYCSESDRDSDDEERVDEFNRKWRNQLIMFTSYDDYVEWDRRFPGEEFPSVWFMSAVDMDSGIHTIGLDVELRADPYGIWDSMRQEDGNRFNDEPDCVQFGVAFLDETLTPPAWVHKTSGDLMFDVFGLLPTDDPRYREEDNFIWVQLELDTANGEVRLTAMMTDTCHGEMPRHTEHFHVGRAVSKLRWFVASRGDVVITPTSSSWSEWWE
jgi:hypothetical protein